MRALKRLDHFFDAFLYVTRDLQGDVLRLLDESRETVRLYESARTGAALGILVRPSRCSISGLRSS